MLVFVLPGSLFLLVPCTMEKKTSTWLSQEACTGGTGELSRREMLRARRACRKPAARGRPTRRSGSMESMPVIPESTKTSLAQRLRAHAKASWPQLAQVHVRFRGQFAYVAGELADGEQVPLMRLRYGGSAHRWGTAIYVASKDSYEDQIWFSGSTEEIFDLVCDLHVPNAGH